MDKYEYQVCADQIKSYIAEKKYVEAMQIADTIDWRRVKSVSMLCTVSEIYKYNKRYEESRDILLLAYDRHPSGRMIIYGLCELSVKMNDVVSAVEYYKEFVRVAPGDTGSYILLYKIYEAQEVSLEERISVLEEYKRRDYKEKWAYELAKLYHITGQESKCVDECNELILWFGEGKYVQKAMELKAQHEDFIKNQQNAAQQPIQSRYIPYSAQQPEPAQFDLPSAEAGEEKYNAEYEQKPEYTIPQKEVTAPGYNTEKLQNELQQSMEQYLGNAEDAETEGFFGQESLYRTDTAEIPDAEPRVSGEGINVQQVEGTAPEKTQEFVFDQNKNYVQQFMSQFHEAAMGIIEEQKAPIDFAKKTIPGIPENAENEGEASGPQQEDRDQETAVSTDEPEGSDTEGFDGGSGIEQPAAEGIDVKDADIEGSDTKEAPDAPSEGETKEDISEEAREPDNGSKDRTYELPTKREPVYSAVNALKYDALLGQEYNGQIRMSLPDTDMVEKQITGQIDIEEILRKRRERLAKLSNTDEFLWQLNGVIPGEESTGETAPTAASVEISELENGEHEASQEEVTVKEPVAGSIALEETEEEEPQEETEAGALKEALEEEPENNEETEENETPEVNEETEENETPEVSDYEIRYAEETGESEEAEEPEETGESEEIEEPEESEEGGYTPQPSEEHEEEAEEESEEEAEDGSGYVIPARPFFGYELDDYGEVEEIEDIEQPDEVDDIIKTSNLPLEEIAEYNAMAEHAINAGNNESAHPSNYDENGRMKHPSYMVLEEHRTSRRDFDEDEYRLFGRYDGIESVKAQLVDVIDDMSMQSDKGNIVVMGDEVSCRKTLSIDLVKAMQMMDSSFTGKVAKISGEALNKKNIPATLKKLDSGALIIEEAGGLSAAGLTIIAQCLTREMDSILIVLEGSRETIMPLLETNPTMFNMVFDARIDIEEFSNDDLVAYAKGYAREQEHSIDEMGILALYTRIGELQTLDNKVTVEDIKELIDNAIAHVDRMTLAHLMDVLVSKRYDDDDFIIIREKDFLPDGKKHNKKEKKQKKKKEE